MKRQDEGRVHILRTSGISKEEVRDMDESKLQKYDQPLPLRANIASYRLWTMRRRLGYRVKMNKRISKWESKLVPNLEYFIGCNVYSD